MGTEADKAARVRPPIEGGVFNYATAATSQRFEIPDAWRGRTVYVRALTVDVRILFGDSAVAAEVDQQSSVTSEVITFDDGSSWPVLAGEVFPYTVPPKGSPVTHFAYIAADDTGRVAIAPVDEPNSTRTP